MSRHWRWRFRRVEELWLALEEYADMHDGTVCRRYDSDGRGGGEGTGDAKRQRLMRQNVEIDRLMDNLLPEAPLLWRIVDLYFRRGLCQEARGWEIAAARCGLPAGRERARDREHFGRLLDVAVEYLWRARGVRRGRT